MSVFSSFILKVIVEDEKLLDEFLKSVPLSIKTSIDSFGNVEFFFI